MFTFIAAVMLCGLGGVVQHDVSGLAQNIGAAAALPKQCMLKSVESCFQGELAVHVAACAAGRCLFCELLRGL